MSGLYVWKLFGPIIPIPSLPLIVSEELRLDVDGFYPQNVASGVIHGGLRARLHWIARVTRNADGSYSGTIFCKDGNVALLPQTDVRIVVSRLFFGPPSKATVTFSGGGVPPRSRVFAYVERYFHHVDFEFDAAEGEAALLHIATGDHPNRPATLPDETLTIPAVYERSGFKVSTSPGGSVPIAGAGADVKWSDAEMHDAMQVYWSKFAPKAQWATWVFFASLHEAGTALGGIMFDDIGPQQRQGTAIFNDSFIKNPPAGDPAPAAWIRRMNFWTAVHEMGHTFNLAHSWQKSLGVPWVPLTNEPEARSFMNYPFRVAGGQASFFSDFHFRFSDSELLFLRHAPERFVQHGNALWFDHHGFNEARIAADAKLQFEIRIDKSDAVYEYLEPVVLELRVTNTSPDPLIIDEQLLLNEDRIAAVVKYGNAPAREFRPYARRCYEARARVLHPGESLAESLFISADTSGWQVAEPGTYVIRVAIDLDDQDLVSNELRLRVMPPKSRDEERIAQDYFTNDVGRVLAFDGTAVLTNALDTLATVASKFDESNAAIHAALPVALSTARPQKRLTIDDDGAARFVLSRVTVKEAVHALAPLQKRARAIETLGAVDYAYYFNLLVDLLSPAVANDLAKLEIRRQDVPPTAGRPAPSPTLRPSRPRAR